MLFGVGAPEQKFWATARMSATYCRHFFLEKFFVPGHISKNICPIFGRPINFGHIPHVVGRENAKKNRFFWISLICYLDTFRYWFQVQNTSKTSQGPISGHISSFRPISATLSKFEFLAKIDFLANFGIFDFSKYDLPFGRKWPEIWLVVGNCFFGPPKHFYMTYMIFNDH